jgi:hypothetical protein
MFPYSLPDQVKESKEHGAEEEKKSDQQDSALQAPAPASRLGSEEKKSDQQDSALQAPAPAPRLGSNEQERKAADRHKIKAL